MKKQNCAMSIEEIAEEEDITVGAVQMTISRSLKKLRSLRTQGLLLTAAELATYLDRNKNAEHTVRRVRGR